MKLTLEPKRLSRFRHGLLANFAGSGWAALIQVICIPLYIRLMGIEAYGLIGFHMMFQALLQVLDLGLSPTINRELARYSVQPEKASEARHLVRTLEAGYWAIGLVVGAALVAAAPWIATHWIKSTTVPVGTVTHAVTLMGLLTVFQWPISLYQGGLLGLGRQVLYNGLVVCFSTLSNVGAVLILWLVSPSIHAFFWWLVVTNALKAAFFVAFLWKSLPPSSVPASFDFGRIRGIVGFAGAMSGITVTTLILMLSDKVILSKVLDLRVFGYYTIAGMFGTGLAMIVSAVFNTTYPRFSALVALGDERALTDLYHGATQATAVLILPLAALAALFSTEILQLWTRNADVAQHTGPIASLLVIGTALNGLMTLPYALQLAYGWTTVALGIAVCLTIAFVPGIWFMATNYGAVGAASVWAVLNCVYMIVGIPITHRRLLKGEAWRWLGDIGWPLALGLLIASIGKGILWPSMSAPTAVLMLLALLACSTAAAAWSSPAIKPRLLAYLTRTRMSC